MAGETRLRCTSCEGTGLVVEQVWVGDGVDVGDRPCWACHGSGVELCVACDRPAVLRVSPEKGPLCADCVAEEVGIL